MTLTKEEELLVARTETPFAVSLGVSMVQTLMFVYDLITFPVYYVVQKPWQKVSEASLVRARPTRESETSVVFTPEPVFCSQLVPFESAKITTMNECIDYMVERHSHARMVGSRVVLGEEDERQPNGKVFKKLDLGDYEWSSYVDIDRKAANMGRGLRELGLEPKSNACIFAETRSEWLISAFACFKQNYPLVTLYANLGEDAVAHGINETEATLVFTTHELMPKFRAILRKTPLVKHLVYIKDAIQSVDLTNYREDVTLISLDELIELGCKSNKFDRLTPRPEDPAIIMYTSGSTGMPKGVVLPHRALISTIKSFHVVVDAKKGDIYLGYLPMAHVLELLSEMTMFVQGVAVGYSSPNTMTDKSTKIKKGQLGDCSLLRPTLMCAVPLVIDRIYKGIQDQIKAKGVFFEHLMNFFFVYKSQNLQKGYSTPILDALVFKKMRQLVGGRIRMLLSGGAPLTSHTHNFVRLAFSLPLVQGYGLTETCACACVMSRQELTTGRNGPPLQGVKIRLVDWPEGNYTAKDKPRPRGEIIVGGGNVATGYYRMPEKTSEDFYTDADGMRWFRTGDIGEMFEDGTLKIIDRKKDLIKLSYGEYVSLGKVEAVFKTCGLVETICICGDSTKAYCVALIVPDHNKLQKLASEEVGMEDTSDIASLCKKPEVVKAFLKELKTHGSNSGLEKFELPGAITLLSEPWTPDSGLVTAAFKLKRKPIIDRFSKELKRMYGGRQG